MSASTPEPSSLPEPVEGRQVGPTETLTPDELYEAELAEAARLDGGGWDAPAAGKADNFGKSFARMIGLLKPSALWFVLVSIFGAIGVALTVAAPKVLGEATNLIYEGFISKQLGDNGVPAGTSQEQVVEMLRSTGQDDFANMVAAFDHFQVGAGIDFDRLRWVGISLLASYVGPAYLSCLQCYVNNVIMLRTMWLLR